MEDLHIHPVKNKELFDFSIRNLQARNYNLYDYKIQKDKENHQLKPNSRTFDINISGKNI